MRPAFVVTGTDTDVGKTVLAAALVAALDGCYWKPVQAGLAEETDAEIVQRLGGRVVLDLTVMEFHTNPYVVFPVPPNICQKAVRK